MTMQSVLKRTTRQMETKIEELIQAGEITLIDAEDFPSLLECARRYVETEHRKRERTIVRAKEHSAVERSAKIHSQYREKAAKIVTGVAVAAVKQYIQWTKDLLDSSFFLPDGTEVTWGDATKVQHNLYIGMLKSQRSGLDKNIDLHELAIFDIEEGGASSLRELVTA
ncbi:hypothetical protein [Frigoribacterium sp. UYMn621]|uniref:hypothetical protein n=1 Tax=Frigoribacterium sp. UYMn621 TaxID=3156343 RepID=UPI00339939AC